MKCQICNENDADVIVGLNNGEEESNLFICHKCISKMGLNIQDNVMNQLLSLFEKQGHNNIKCESCGKSYIDFIKTGRYGCKDCHHFFDNDNNEISKENKLNMENDRARASYQENTNRDLIKDFFDSEKFQQSYKNIFSIKKMLVTAIKQENYEEAARLRDKLNHIDNEYIKKF